MRWRVRHRRWFPRHRRNSGTTGLEVLQIAVILGKVEDREPLTVLRDLSAAGVDLIQIAAPEDRQRSVSVDAGVNLDSMAREVLLAAACAAVRPSEHTGKADHETVDGEFPEDARARAEWLVMIESQRIVTLRTRSLHPQPSTACPGGRVKSRH